ncbi:calcium-activated chloride channel-domain-containing protein [Fimicolochytrium jonesii]|uniref:calcium-activated chloride channel-domain-containing protein n=1 Tax=Fimicolochytrium jonesii TaxID=1396493 RepID=UPI0022FE865D|nr:calcium-activated chloride channel-domain-containing protein [Fimicolochytrium jonesii]KAI8815815.1 calcium-activated chloride channel-domain-containing protein [Fimicolochytrium jonesii]
MVAQLRPPRSQAVPSADSAKDQTTFAAHQTDWIIVFNTKLPRATAKGLTPEALDDRKGAVLQAWDDVISRLLSVKLTFQVQQWGSPEKLAILVRCPDDVLRREIYRTRVIDWLNNSGASVREPPVTLTDLELPPLTEAERLRLVYELLTTPTYEGGAGLTMDEDVVGKTDAVGGKFIEAIYAPHDKEFTDKWIKSWTKRWLLTDQDIDAIRDYAGEKVAFYFAFLRFYVQSLIIPSVIGGIAYLWQGDFSPVYGVLIIVWSVVFIAVWDRRASVYARRWGTRNFSKIEKIRPEFRPTSILTDPVTHERLPFYPYWKRWATTTLITVPINLTLVGVLICVVFTIVSSDVYFHKYYDGPGKEFVGFIPTIVYGACIPTFHSYYTRLANHLSYLENLPTDTQHAATFTQKLFTFNSLVAFFALFAEAYIFIPCSTWVGSILKSKGYIWSMSFEVGPASLQSRLIYLVITGQAINAVTEVVLPLVLTRWSTRKQGLEVTEAQKREETEDECWARRARKEFERPAYNVADDYSEMVIQFGYIMLFSPCWPLTPLFCLINNFLELRADAFKICKAARRPVPQRADNIGPWSKNLRLISYVGSALTIPSLLTLYRNWNLEMDAGVQVKARLPNALAAVLIAEHVYLLLQYVINEAVNSVPIQGGEQLKRAEFEVKKRYLLKAGIDVLAGGHGGSVRWSEGDGGERKGEDAVLFGVALGRVHEALKGVQTH